MSGNENSQASNGSASSETPPRLTSFKLPRDLTLGGSKVPPRKVFTPNLNVIRNKNKQNLPQATHVQHEPVARGRFDRGRGRGAPRGRGYSIIKSEGIFSEGMAAPERLSSSRSSYAAARESNSAQAVIEKPVLRVKSLWKIDKELEDMHIKELMKTDISEQQEEEILNDHNTPVRLPVAEGSSMYLKRKTVEDIKREFEEPKVKLEMIIIKKEPGSFETLPPDMTDAPKNSKEFGGRLEAHATPKEVNNLLQGNSKITVLLLQLPDNLPGRVLQAESSKKAKMEVSNAEIKDSVCNLRQLDECQIGKIIIHKSGKVKLKLGEIYFDLDLGTQSCFMQKIVSTNIDSDINIASVINLGFMENKLTVIPDWERLFPEV